jgi:hypothetical protein
MFQRTSKDLQPRRQLSSYILLGDSEILLKIQAAPPNRKQQATNEGVSITPPSSSLLVIEKLRVMFNYNNWKFASQMCSIHKDLWDMLMGKMRHKKG